MDRSAAASPAAYLKELPPERRKVVSAARAIVKKAIPKGYKEMMEWGMIAWSVPLSVCPETYNGKPLLYAALSGHNKNATLYLMSAYGHEPALKTLQQGSRRPASGSTWGSAASTSKPWTTSTCRPSNRRSGRSRWTSSSNTCWTLAPSCGSADLTNSPVYYSMKPLGQSRTNTDSRSANARGTRNAQPDEVA